MRLRGVAGFNSSSRAAPRGVRMRKRREAEPTQETVTGV